MWILFDYVNEHDVNEFAQWTRGLEKRQRVKLNQKLDMLQKHGPDLPPQLLAGPIFQHIYKLKVKGNVQLRPMLCKGPINNDAEFTLLLGAVEIGDELNPSPEEAARIRDIIIAAPRHRRRLHERIN
jgi:hypothetical protein